jgi:LPS-assembly protein
MRRGLKKILTVFAVLLAATGLCVPANGAETEEPSLLLTADEMTYDRDLGVVTASGNVEIADEDRILLADTISYNQRLDVLTASGNVRLLEPSGEVIFAEYAELTGDMKDGIIRNLRILLSDKARIAAAGARRSEGTVLEMRRAVYSPCNLCPDDPTRPPLWQMKAIKVVHDKPRQTIAYTDAWLEIAGFPVAYTPYLIHPDPTVKRQSGFLVPSVGGSSDLGFVFQTPYFFNIAPHQDATVTPIYTSEQGPVLAGEYRHLLTDGEFQAEGSITHDSSEDIRGHILSKGRFDVDDTWRWGFNIDRTTDDTYLRRYGFGGSGTLTSRLFAEGFRKKNYLAANAYVFQGLSAEDDQGSIPYVMPMIDYNHVGEADPLGGRTSLDTSLLALTRTDGTDTRRVSAKVGWHRPYVGGLGDLYSLSASLQGDLYHVNDLSRNGEEESFNGLTGRLIPEVAVDWRYPFVREEGSVYQLIEPIASAIVSPYGGNPSKIPNEDSLDFEFDDTNLFKASRFTGVDRVEGGPRFNYGVHWGVFGRGGGSTSVLVGQSYRVKSDDTFAAGSGVEDNFSDIVARLRVSPGDFLETLYRTRLDKDNFGARRNELSLSIGPPALRLSTDYIFFDRQEDSEFQGREEVRLALDAKLTRYWRTHMSAIRDLTGGGDMRSAGIGATYEDECLAFTVDITRTFFEDRDLEPTDAVMLRATFKTLGEVQSQVK